MMEALYREPVLPKVVKMVNSDPKYAGRRAVKARAARWSRAVLPAVVALPLLVACGSGGGHPAGSPSGGPPPGGWPKPVNGKLTPAMCGLLTDADYQRYGRMRMGRISAKRSAELGPNVATCLYQGDDSLELNLQPGIVSGHLIYMEDLRRHENDRPRAATPPSTDVVPGADESWFDLAGDDVPGGHPEYQVEFRRGALVTTLQLGFLDGAKKVDPQTMLSGLAQLVMKRASTGTSGPGTHRTVHYRVHGHGVAKLLMYTDPNSMNVRKKKHVHLPWSTAIPYGERGAAQQNVQLTALEPPTGFAPAPTLTCTVTTEHHAPIENTGPGSATCQGSLS